MKKTMGQIARWIWNGIYMIFVYIFLMIDRQILVPFQWISSYSAQELEKKPDRYASFAMIRVLIALIITGLVILIKTIL